MLKSIGSKVTIYNDYLFASGTILFAYLTIAYLTIAHLTNTKLQVPYLGSPKYKKIPKDHLTLLQPPPLWSVWRPTQPLLRPQAS